MTLNILVVDDSETVRAIVGKTLRIAGIPVSQLHQAANGREALEILQENWVDLVLSDINMPEMGGVEMLERMQQDELLKTIPVIVVSTEGSATRIEALQSLGVRAYIRKPFNPEQLRAVIVDILGEFDASDETNPR
ncbi:MAG: response regulator [Candidatus Hydrogenedentota bacterium]